MRKFENYQKLQAFVEAVQNGGTQQQRRELVAHLQQIRKDFPEPSCVYLSFDKKNALMVGILATHDVIQINYHLHGVASMLDIHKDELSVLDGYIEQLK